MALWFGLAAIAAGSCTGDDRLGMAEAPLAAVPVINAVTDAGSFQGSHYLTLWGSFPADSTGCTSQPLWERGALLTPSTGCYAVDIQCNGALIQPAVITGYSASFINVAFPDRPTGSRCTARVKRSLHSDVVAGGVKLSNESWPGNVHPGQPSPIAPLQPPPLETVGSIDRGITAGLHYYELYGRYPAASGAPATPDA
jgi:hypothetical protein